MLTIGQIYLPLFVDGSLLVYVVRTLLPLITIVVLDSLNKCYRIRLQ